MKVGVVWNSFLFRKLLIGFIIGFVPAMVDQIDQAVQNHERLGWAILLTFVGGASTATIRLLLVVLPWNLVPSDGIHKISNRVPPTRKKRTRPKPRAKPRLKRPAVKKTPAPRR